MDNAVLYMWQGGLRGAGGETSQLARSCVLYVRYLPAACMCNNVYLRVRKYRPQREVAQLYILEDICETQYVDFSFDTSPKLNAAGINAAGIIAASIDA